MERGKDEENKSTRDKNKSRNGDLKEEERERQGIKQEREWQTGTKRRKT